MSNSTALHSTSQHTTTMKRARNDRLAVGLLWTDHPSILCEKRVTSYRYDDTSMVMSINNRYLRHSPISCRELNKTNRCSTWNSSSRCHRACECFYWPRQPSELKPPQPPGWRTIPLRWDVKDANRFSWLLIAS
eukprot:jgi/Psemu1/310170/fgenesh1_kg.600_\